MTATTAKELDRMKKERWERKERWTHSSDQWTGVCAPLTAARLQQWSTSSHVSESPMKTQLRAPAPRRGNVSEIWKWFDYHNCNKNIYTQQATVTAPHSIPGCPKNYRGESELSTHFFRELCILFVYMFLTNTLQAEFLAKTRPCFWLGIK